MHCFKNHLLDELLRSKLKIKSKQKFISEIHDYDCNIQDFEYCIKTNISKNELKENLFKKTIHSFNVCFTFLELKLFLETELNTYKCIAIQSHEETVKQFIESVSKHLIDYYIYYENKTSNILIILIAIADYEI